MSDQVRHLNYIMTKSWLSIELLWITFVLLVCSRFYKLVKQMLCLRFMVLSRSGCYSHFLHLLDIVNTANSYKLQNFICIVIVNDTYSSPLPERNYPARRQNRRPGVPEIILSHRNIWRNVNKYGTVQELRSTSNHTKTPVILILVLSSL